jgi:hypothetical protein
MAEGPTASGGSGRRTRRQEDPAIGALLHDAADDQGGAETLRGFGDAVAEIVSDCTDAWTEPKPDWRPRRVRPYALQLRPLDTNRVCFVLARGRVATRRISPTAAEVPLGTYLPAVDRCSL